MVLTGVMSKPHLCSNQQIALSARLSHETFQCYTAMYSAIHRCCFLWIGIYRWIADHHPSSVARLAGGMERAAITLACSVAWLAGGMTHAGVILLLRRGVGQTVHEGRRNARSASTADCRGLFHAVFSGHCRCERGCKVLLHRAVPSCRGRRALVCEISEVLGEGGSKGVSASALLCPVAAASAHALLCGLGCERRCEGADHTVPGCHGRHALACGFGLKQGYKDLNLAVPIAASTGGHRVVSGHALACAGLCPLMQTRPEPTDLCGQHCVACIVRTVWHALRRLCGKHCVACTCGTGSLHAGSSYAIWATAVVSCRVASGMKRERVRHFLPCA
eukprot:1157768-Pelagomonas_calceolata.AAC.1